MKVIVLSKSASPQGGSATVQFRISEPVAPVTGGTLILIMDITSAEKYILGANYTLPPLTASVA